MPILENATDYAEDGQVTHTNLNALTESAKFVKAGAGVTNTGNTTDETSCNINATGEIEVKDLGVSTAKLAADCVTEPKIADDAVGNEHIEADAVSGTGSGQGGADANVLAASIGPSELGTDCVNQTHTHVNMIASQTDHPAGDVPADTDSVMAYDASANDLTEMTMLKMSQYLPFPKAFGVFTTEATPTTSALYNVSSVTRTVDGTFDVFRVTLVNAMVDGNYVVMASAEDPTTDASASITIQAKTDTTFDLSTNLAADSSHKINFTVFGAQDGYSA